VNLRQRTAISVGLPFLAVAVVLCCLFQQFVLGQFEAIERLRSAQNVNRVLLAIDATRQALVGRTVDWGQWDDTFAFIEDRNEKYIDSMLIYDTLAPIQVRHIVYVDHNKSSVVSRKVAVESQVVESVPDDELKTILGLPGFLEHETAADHKSGMVQIGEDLLLIASVSIVDSKREQASRGSLIFTQLITDSFIKQIATQTRLKVGSVSLGQNLNQSAVNLAAIKHLRDAMDTFTEVTNDSEIVGFGAFFDIASKPVLLLRVPQNRDIYAQGVSVRNYLITSLMLTTALALCITLLLLDRTVLRRLASLGKQLARITDSKDFTKRVEGLGSDELGHLTTEVNSMLTSLEDANDESQAARLGAEEANAAISIFIAKVSHELRTPIHGVIGMLRILLKEEQSLTKKNYISMAKHSAYSLLQTINEILDFSKIESGNLSLEKIDFSLRQVLRETLRTVAPRAEEKEKIELVYDIMADVPDQFVGDSLRIKQMLINLLGNSIKFTPSGFVKLMVECVSRTGDGTRLVMRVSDSGVGIPAERLPHIFDPFTQADDSVARVFTGTGLGLTIVKQLVEQMNGAVEVTSEVGKGTTFTLTFELPEVVGSEWAAPAPTFAPTTVAIIDAGSYSATVMHEALKRYGVDSVIVPSGEPESVAALAANIARYRLVVVTTEAIKRSHVFNFAVEVAAHRLLPLVVVLSPFEISVRERLVALDVPFVLTRPVSLEDVLLTVAGKIPPDAEVWEADEDITQQSSRKLSIIIADDAQTNRIILSNMLEDAGHEVTCVDNGLDLLSALQSQITGSSVHSHFDLVMTDIQMPLMDGITATKEIRKLEAQDGRRTHIPIIAVTAHAMTEEAEHMKSCGVDDVVTKPIEPPALARVLERLMGVTTTASSLKQEPVLEETRLPAQTESEALLATVLRAWEKVRGAADLLDCALRDAGLPVERVLDVEDVYERSGESVRRTRLILNAFLSSYKDPLAELLRSVSAQDSVAVKSGAHALKGLLLDIGAKAAAEVAATIEAHGKQGESELGAQHVGELEAQVVMLARLVEQIVEALPAPAPKKVAETVVVLAEQVVLPPANSISSDPTQFLTIADKAVRETAIQLSEQDLQKLMPLNLFAEGGGHPSIELVYQLLDVHGVVARQGQNTTKSLLVFGAFLKGYEDLLTELDRSQNERDVAKLKLVSQALRDVLADTGCPLGADVAYQIEQLCELGQVDDAIKLCEALKSQTRVIGKMLQRIVDDARI
jgi:signal transduction histidine kinase/CheY-like chemotaxis protein/HPt (histidine-containing phosphotransfer) domain-containing protein